MKAAKPTLPKGFTCAKCAREHKYPFYVYSHWEVSLEVKCECGAVSDIFRGVATLNPKKK